MPNARAGIVGAAINNKIYVIGGAYEKSDVFIFSSLNEEYTPVSDDI